MFRPIAPYLSRVVGRTFSSQYRINSAFRLPTGSDGKENYEGTLARTDSSIQVEHPPENHLPKSRLVQGRGGLHCLRTLPSFSLEGSVGVVTGGARGLGLMMSQALIISGADLAIVDLDSEPTLVIK
jgi:D-arabinitol 2-dehydrogenase